jgi:hypothetical protein
VIGWKCSCITRSELRGASCEDWKSAFKHYSSSPTISDIEPAMEKRIPHKVNISKDLYQIHIRMGNKTWNSQNVISIFWFAQMDYSIPKSYTNSTNTSNLNLPFLSRFTFWTGWVYKLTYTQQFRLPNFIGQFLKFCNLFTISSNKVQRSSICGNCSQKFGFWNRGGIFHFV